MMSVRIRFRICSAAEELFANALTVIHVFVGANGNSSQSGLFRGTQTTCTMISASGVLPSTEKSPD